MLSVYIVCSAGKKL